MEATAFRNGAVRVGRVVAVGGLVWRCNAVAEGASTGDVGGAGSLPALSDVPRWRLPHQGGCDGCRSVPSWRQPSWDMRPQMQEAQ